MKTRKIKSLLYIFSSVMVLGLALVSFDAEPSKQTSTTPSGTPADPTPSVSAGPLLTNTPTPIATLTPTPSPTPTNTPTPTLSPTPTPSLAEINAAIPILPATDEIGIQLTTVITDYLNKFYSNEELNVKEISNITCYYKEGLSYADYIVYVTYDINYKQSNVLIPALDEYCISYEGDTATVHPEPLDEDVREALFLSRVSKSVSTLYVQETVHQFMQAELAGDETMLASLILDPSQADLPSRIRRVEYITERKSLQYMIRFCSDKMEELDYIVYVIHDDKIVNIATYAPGMDEYHIKLDEQNYPKIVLPTLANDYVLFFRSQKSIQEAIKEVTNQLLEAMTADPNLASFINKLYGNAD